jgi:hypothetical protein
MRIRELCIAAAICFTTGANAEDCADLYSAVKYEAMHCGFFCDQAKLAPLQVAYEANCIVMVIPLATLAIFENALDEPAMSLHGMGDNNLISSKGTAFHSE